MKTNPYKLAEGIAAAVIFLSLVLAVLGFGVYAITLNGRWPQTLHTLAWIAGVTVSSLAVLFAWDWWTTKRDEWDQYNGEGPT